VVADYQSVVFKHQALLDIWTAALLRVCIVVLRLRAAHSARRVRAQRVRRALTCMLSLVRSLTSLAVWVVD